MHSDSLKSSPSIYRRILGIGMLIVAFSLGLNAMLAFFATRAEVSKLFNAALIENTRVIKGLINHPSAAIDWQYFQQALNDSADMQRNKQLNEGFAYQKELAIQVWTVDGVLTAATPSAKKTALAALRLGFSRRKNSTDTWYVYTVWLDQNNHWLMVAERADIRKELARNIAASTLLCALICMALIFWLFRLHLRRSLAPLQQLVKLISRRKANDLIPLTLPAPPHELVPVLDELNTLFATIRDSREREQRFLSDAAHELRTPLAVIKLQVQQALGVEDARKQSYLEKLLTSVDRNQQVIEQLLMLARLEREQSLELKPIDLETLAQETVSQLIPMALTRNIHIELHAPSTTTIYGDAALCVALIRNLIDNALKHAPEHSVISIDIQHTENQRILSVTDQGAGVDAAHVEHMTTRFWQANNSPNNKGLGNGLGLAIVAMITNLHHASLKLSNAQPSGLKVSVEFPTYTPT